MAPGAGHHNPLVVLFAPIAGGLVIGLMARYGSEKIRGHGMPEAADERKTLPVAGALPARPPYPVPY